MKNLLIYLHPDRKFTNGHYDNETELLPKIQIDNSLALGWEKDDILLVTNFHYEYNGVKSLVVSTDNFNIYKPTATKINVIVDLYDKGIIDGLFWYHDLDAFQLEKITEEEVKAMLVDHDLALTDYGITTINEGRNKRWSTGTLFFDGRARYIFDTWKFENYRYKENEEIILLEILKKKRNQIMKKRINRINITYNLASRRRNIPATYEIAEKPVKVVHFHPMDKRLMDKKHTNIEIFLQGKGGLDKPLVTNGLSHLFQAHGIV